MFVNLSHWLSSLLSLILWLLGLVFTCLVVYLVCAICATLGITSSRASEGEYLATKSLNLPRDIGCEFGELGTYFVGWEVSSSLKSPFLGVCVVCVTNKRDVSLVLFIFFVGTRKCHHI